MEYGILILETDGGAYRVLGVVDSFEDAKRCAREYLQWADPDTDPEPARFVVHRRNALGSYIVREELPLDHLAACEVA